MPNETSKEVIARLQATIHGVLAPFVPKSGQFALCDFPDHINVGDSAIWLGSIEYFHRMHNIYPAYVSTTEVPSRQEMEKALPDGPMFLHGGGNVGDLWPVFQKNREDILERFRDRKIIQLPQTIQFNHSDALASAVQAINSHPDFTLLVRDYRSYGIAKKFFSCDVQMCPDMAFFLGPLTRPIQPLDPLLLLLRNDHEQMTTSFPALPPGTITADWSMEDDTNMKAALRLKTVMLLLPSLRSSAFNKYRRRELRYRFLAEARLARGLNILSSGGFVITDRLHGHILATLFDMPHIALDIIYGKISGFVEAWTEGCDIMHTESNLTAAVELYQTIKYNQ
jgi:exopolysaccharide biosynthesis predicted pyruvyltransferase EpsI